MWYRSLLTYWGCSSMSQYVIEGGRRLEGELQIDGCKNAVLPIIAATLLNEDITYIEKCPKISDVLIMQEILGELGCNVKWQGETLVIDTHTLTSYKLDETLVKEMRSSIILLGALMGRCGKARVSTPGGCKLGARPIDLHLEALKKMNIEIIEQDELIDCKTSHLQGATIKLKFPSVGATENIMLAATRSEGITVIQNAAREPEIIDLQNFLLACGAKVKGAGTSIIVIEGVKKLNGTRYQVIPDRIIAGTYLVAAAMTRGHIVLDDVYSDHLRSTLTVLRRMGCKIREEKQRIILECPKEIKGINIITKPYPGFPTDMQSQMMALLCTCKGTTFIKENLFESRFSTATELRQMGANIEICRTTAYVRSCKKLHGASVRATDLRGGAALVLAGLAADGCTIVDHIDYIQRGYQDIVGDLTKLGAKIQERN